MTIYVYIAATSVLSAPSAPKSHSDTNMTKIKIYREEWIRIKETVGMN